jgi:hypothetical protein
MHVLPLPFGLALALFRRPDEKLLRLDDRSDDPPTQLAPGPAHRDRLLGDVTAAACRRPIG